MIETVKERRHREDKEREVWQLIQDRYERRSNYSRFEEGYLQFINDVAGKFKDFIGIRDGIVLDIGCGNGKFCGKSYEDAEYEYIDNKNTIIGLDPLESTEKRFPVVRGFGESLPFQDACIGTVVIGGAMDHIIDPIIVLKEAKRILKVGGKIFIWNAICLEGGENPWHLHAWTKDLLLEMVGEVFTVTRAEIAGNENGGFSLWVEGAC